jgi:hypothetical protein
MSKSTINPKLFHTLNVGDVVTIVRDFHEAGHPERGPYAVAIKAIDRSPDIGDDRSQGAPQICVDIDGQDTCLNAAFVYEIVSRVKRPGAFQPFNSLYHERNAYLPVSDNVWTRRGPMISAAHPFALAKSVIAHDPSKHVPYGLSKVRFDAAWKQAGYPGARGVWDHFAHTFEQGRPPEQDGNGFTFAQVSKTWWLHLPKFKAFVERRLPLFVKTMAEVTDEGAASSKKFYQDYLDDEAFDRRREQNEANGYEPDGRFAFADEY